MFRFQAESMHTITTALLIIPEGVHTDITEDSIILWHTQKILRDTEAVHHRIIHMMTLVWIQVFLTLSNHIPAVFVRTALIQEVFQAAERIMVNNFNGGI